MMRTIATLLAAAAIVALADVGVSRAGTSGEAPQAEQTYEFNETDIRMIVSKISESLLTLDQPGFADAKVAWLRLRNDTEERKLPLNLLMEAIEVALMKSGRCQILRRTELEAIAAEHALSMTALMDPAGASRIGGLGGVDYWLSATLTSRTNREDGKEYVYYNFTSFLTDARTSERVWGDAAEIKKARKLQLVEKRFKG
jgi:PBP1b-binding outer membrane lipoprotein LpoB